MPFTISDKGGSDFEPIPAGAHYALCNMVVDMGLQEGFEGKPQHKLHIRWEVPDERVEFQRDGKAINGPAVIGQTYTASLSEKATLRKALEAWRGRPFTKEELEAFEPFALIGAPCQIMVEHKTVNGKTRARVTAVMSISKDQKGKSRQLENQPLTYSPMEHTDEAYQRLPEWLRKAIDGRLNADAAQDMPERHSASGGSMDDDIPFRQFCARSIV